MCVPSREKEALVTPCECPRSYFRRHCPVRTFHTCGGSRALRVQGGCCELKTDRVMHSNQAKRQPQSARVL
jgi:hypothetical protein